MKNITIKSALLVIAILAFTFATKLQAQITIGSCIKPADAALLDIKTQTAHATTNVTSNKGGLGLPRVQLTNKKTLEPFIVNNADFQSNKDKVKDLHIGLVVYNLTSNLATETDANKRFRAGVYVWNGATWNFVYEGQGQLYFFIPSFNISIGDKAVGDLGTYNLYNEYTTQFSAKLANGSPNPTFVSSNPKLERIPSPGFDRLYLANELDYVITYYDRDVFEDVSIGAQGVLNYKVKSHAITPNSFVNVVFVIKEDKKK